MNEEILTGKITNTELGYEDHGIFTCFLHIEGDGWGCGFGGYSLDSPDKTLQRRKGTAEGMEAIIQIIRTLDVNSWEKVKGQYVRVVLKDRRIKKIGHIIKDNWFSFEDFFNQERS